VVFDDTVALDAFMEMLVIADEIISIIRQFGSGVPINKETLGLEALALVHPGCGFLSDESTLKDF